MTGKTPKAKRNSNNLELQQSSVTPKVPPYSRKKRKADNPVRSLPPSSSRLEKSSSSWVCENPACTAVVTMSDTFCKSCACCICRLFDDPRDPSLWLLCLDDGQRDSCGMSCHIHCALKIGKVGVVNLEQLTQLDGSYCCAYCGKVSEILGCWKNQLSIAKDARRVEVMCSKIVLSYRLFDGTSRFKELHDIVAAAKAKLETEFGSELGASTKMPRGMVSKLSIAGDVQKLCSEAIAKADEWLAAVSTANPSCPEKDSPSAAWSFIFQEVTAFSVSVEILAGPLNDNVKGFKLWYCQSGDEEALSKEPYCIIPTSQKSIVISNLQPSTEYSFRIISFTEAGDLGSYEEAKCVTKTVEVIPEAPNSAQEEGFYVDIEKSAEVGDIVKPESPSHERWPIIPHGLDLNMSVPDLNEELSPQMELAPFEDKNCSVEHAVELDANTFADDVEKSAPVEFEAEIGKNGEKGPDNCLTSVRPTFCGSGLDLPNDNLERCIQIFRSLEREGLIESTFRMKLLTWFGLKATAHERRVVSSYIQALGEDPASLAEQLIDSLSDIINNPKQPNKECDL